MASVCSKATPLYIVSVCQRTAKLSLKNKTKTKILKKVLFEYALSGKRKIFNKKRNPPTVFWKPPGLHSSLGIVWCVLWLLSWCSFTFSLQMWPQFRAISAGVGLEKPSPHTGCQKDCVQAGEAEPSFRGLAREARIRVMQTRAVYLFLLSYLSFKNMETRICQERIFMQGKRKLCRLLYNVDLYTYIYKYFLCIMTKVGV